MSITNLKKIIKYRIINFKTIIWFTKGVILKICKSDEQQNFKILAIKKPEYAFLASICCKSLLAVHPNSSIVVVCDQFTKKSFLLNTKLIRKNFDLKIMTIESEKSWQEQKFDLILSMNGSSDIFLDADLIINKKIKKMANPTLFVKEFTFNENIRYRFLNNLDGGMYNNYSMKNTSLVTFNKNSINYEEIENIKNMFKNFNRLLDKTVPLYDVEEKIVLERLKEQIIVSILFEKLFKNIDYLKEKDSRLDGSAYESLYFGSTGLSF